jgi:putative (di)nucleoside polyphosphate hydrolase
MRHQSSPLCVGQKQKWFLLQLISQDNQISLTPEDQKAEFDHWRWVNYWYPLNQVIAFKRDVYRRALKELSPAFCHFQQEIMDTVASNRAVSAC